MPSKTTTNTNTSTGSKGPPGCKPPGPGPIYLLPSTVGYCGHDITKDRKPAYSIGSRYPFSDKTTGPGPSINVEKFDRFGATAGPAFSIYPKIRHCDFWATPGPGTYCPECTPAHGPAFSLSPRIYPPTGKVVIPAPNAYLLPSSLNGTVNYLGKRLDIVDKDRSPGPAKYLPNNDVVKWKGPEFSFGQRHRPPRDPTTKPGPAAYLPMYNTSRNPPQYSFGSKHSDCKGVPLTDADKHPECLEDMPASGA